MNQQGDVKLFQTNDDGDILVEGGFVAMDGGLNTAAFLSLFGGNEDGSTWWGNLTETQPERQYTSETQTLLRALPAIPDNLRRLELAAGRDLAWMISAGVARSVSVVATMPGINRVKLTIDISTGETGAETLEYIENWKADA